MDESQAAAIRDVSRLVRAGLRDNHRAFADDLRAELRATMYWLWALLFALSGLFASTVGSVAGAEAV